MTTSLLRNPKFRILFSAPARYCNSECFKATQKWISIKYYSNGSWSEKKSSDELHITNHLHGTASLSTLANNENCYENENHLLHKPVMLKEVLQYLEPMPGQTIVDMTFGAGGHSTQILESAPDTKIFALDRDPVAFEHAQRLSEKYPGRLIPLLGRFSELPELLKQHNVTKNSIDSFLFDFGCSTMQFDTAERGFAISKNGPLDMRMDGFRCPNEPTAADILERIEERDLVNILRIYGEEKKAKKIARAIIEARYRFRNLRTTQELAQLVASVIGGSIRTDHLDRFGHAATKTFQALRIFVNNELNEINYGIIVARTYLKQNGRMIIISSHSLEDTIVKRHITGNVIENVANALPLRYLDCTRTFTKAEMDEMKYSRWKLMHKNVLTPTREEIETNPRARSAKFRATVKVR